MSSFGESAFWRSAVIAYAIMDVLHMLKLNQSGFIILNTLMLLIRIVLSFVWREFSNVGREEWPNEMKYGQKLKLGMPCHPKKYSRGTSVKAWGCPSIPSSSTKISSPFSMRYIFIASYTMCYSWSVFVFLVFFCFVLRNKWLDPIIIVLEETYSILIT